jgi:hypothetical protein
MAAYIFALIEDDHEGIVEQDFEDHDAAMAFGRSQLAEHGNPKAICQISIAVHTAGSGVEWLGAYTFGAAGRLIWEPVEPETPEEPTGKLN